MKLSKNKEVVILAVICVIAVGMVISMLITGNGENKIDEANGSNIEISTYTDKMEVETIGLSVDVGGKSVEFEMDLGDSEVVSYTNEGRLEYIIKNKRVIINIGKLEDKDNTINGEYDYLTEKEGYFIGIIVEDEPGIYEDVLEEDFGQTLINSIAESIQEVESSTDKYVTIYGIGKYNIKDIIAEGAQIEYNECSLKIGDTEKYIKISGVNKDVEYSKYGEYENVYMTDTDGMYGIQTKYGLYTIEVKGFSVDEIIDWLGIKSSDEEINAVLLE